MRRCSTRIGHPKCEQTPLLLPKQVCITKKEPKIVKEKIAIHNGLGYQEWLENRQDENKLWYALPSNEMYEYIYIDIYSSIYHIKTDIE